MIVVAEWARLAINLSKYAKESSEMYKNETEKPPAPAQGHQSGVMGCSDYKSEAQDIAYGQAGKSGCKTDGSKIVSQMKHYGWSE
jgi:hypothetical protein